MTERIIRSCKTDSQGFKPERPFSIASHYGVQGRVKLHEWVLGISIKTEFERHRHFTRGDIAHGQSGDFDHFHTSGADRFNPVRLLRVSDVWAFDDYFIRHGAHDLAGCVKSPDQRLVILGACNGNRDTGWLSRYSPATHQFIRRRNLRLLLSCQRGLLLLQPIPAIQLYRPFALQRRRRAVR